MSDQVPYPAPPGFMWTKSFLGLFGAWILVEDPENPLPPPGFRYRINFWTAKKELVSVVGKGVDWFSDGNSRPRPAVQHPYLMGSIDKPRYVEAKPIPANKISPGIEFVGPNSAEPPVDKRIAKDSPHQSSNRDTAAIF